MIVISHWDMNYKIQKGLLQTGLEDMSRIKLVQEILEWQKWIHSNSTRTGNARLFWFTTYSPR